jgi:hypothetical protein
MCERCTVPGRDDLLHRLLAQIARKRAEAEGRYSLCVESDDKVGAVRWVAVSIALGELQAWANARCQR